MMVSKILITSALPYINGVKHLGNLVGSMLPADVYARFSRRAGHEVLFICATDEHGTPAELAAHEAGLDVESFCTEMHEVQASLYRQFGLSFDHFGRSSSPQNRELTQRIYGQLDSHGYIQERTIQQIYSLDDERFLPDRYVVGTCPRCGYDKARGDQCESCTSVLDPTELISPRSAVSGSTNLEVRETKHLFLRLDALHSRIHAFIDSHPDWPRLTTSIAYKWLNEGLHERCITRDLSWGVPVPREGFEDKVFYVWFDAPIEYIGSTKEWADLDGASRDWTTWWLDAKDVEHVQFMAKDNVPFHTVFWPGVILGTELPWTLATYIKSFNWLTYYGGKFSTSQKRGIFMDAALELFPADTWRYYLLANAPESDDASFTWESFAQTINKDLAGIFGNYINRTLKLTEKQFGAVIPTGGTPGEAEEQLQASCQALLSEYTEGLRNKEFRKAIQSLRKLWSLGNLYLDQRAPWTVVHSDQGEAAMILRTAIHLARIFAIAASPIIPFTAEQVYSALNLSEEEKSGSWDTIVDFNILNPGRPFQVPSPLFQKIDNDTVAQCVARFGGQ